MNCWGGGIWQPNTNFLRSGKGLSYAPLLYNAWSVRTIWQELSWNDPGVSTDQKQFTYSSLVLNPFRTSGRKESSGRGIQLDKLHLQAADHPGWQVKNPLIPYCTKLSWEVCYTAFHWGFWRSCVATSFSPMPILHRQCWGLCHVQK